MIFTKNSNFKKKSFYFVTLFFHVITAPWTLKGSQIIQGVALIRVVLFNFSFRCCYFSDDNKFPSKT